MTIKEVRFSLYLLSHWHHAATDKQGGFRQGRPYCKTTVTRHLGER